MDRRRFAIDFTLTLLVAPSVDAQAVNDPAEPIILHALQLRKQVQEREALGEFTCTWEMSHTPDARARMALAEQALGGSDDFWRDAGVGGVM